VIGMFIPFGTGLLLLFNFYFWLRLWLSVWSYFIYICTLCFQTS
jgi:hypothetical protein